MFYTLLLLLVVVVVASSCHLKIHEMEFPEANRRLMAALTDPSSGASAESIAKFKAIMEEPGAAFALYRHLKFRDLSKFNPEDIAKMPAIVVENLHKHFPTPTTIRHHRGTQICTIADNACGFSQKGRSLLHDDRVLSLHDVGEQGLKLFVDNCVEIVHPTLHRKMHAVFLKAEGECTKIDLCDLFDWCKCSVLDDRSKNGNDEVTFCFMETPFGRVFMSVHVLKNAEECRVDVLNGDNTVQIQVRKPTVIGIGLFTSNYCKLCRKPGSDTTTTTTTTTTVKLKECSRCIVFGIKLFYCSRTCQLLDYQNHRQVCTYDWSASDWRDTAPKRSSVSD